MDSHLLLLQSLQRENRSKDDLFLLRGFLKENFFFKHIDRIFPHILCQKKQLQEEVRPSS